MESSHPTKDVEEEKKGQEDQPSPLLVQQQDPIVAIEKELGVKID